MRTALIALALILPAAASAQDACPQGAEPIPPALVAWRAGAALDAAASVDAAPALAIGKPAEVALHPAAHLKLPVAPGRPAAAGTHGGIVAFDVASAGTYRVALAAPAWIEVVAAGKPAAAGKPTAAGKPIASTSHGHGPRCSGIRKIVDFALRPGRHLLQISGSPVAGMRAMVAPAR